jgi:hypothetical protein
MDARYFSLSAADVRRLAYQLAIRNQNQSRRRLLQKHLARDNPDHSITASQHASSSSSESESEDPTPVDTDNNNNDVFCGGFF